LSLLRDIKAASDPEKKEDKTKRSNNKMSNIGQEYNWLKIKIPFSPKD